MNWERIRKHPEDCVGANLMDTKSMRVRFLGRRRGRCSTAYPVAGSTSHMKRSTDTSWRVAAADWLCAGSDATMGFATLATRLCARR